MTTRSNARHLTASAVSVAGVESMTTRSNARHLIASAAPVAGVTS
jgi:hypothetical protein